MTDMVVIVFCSGLERAKSRWTNLMTFVSVRVVKFWVRGRDGLGFLEAEG
jgi:hypothetical protein